MNHGVGVALKVNLIPDWMKHAEMKKKSYPKNCPFYGCLEKHVTTKAKGCKNNGVLTRNHILPPILKQVSILSINLCEKNGGKKASNEYTEPINKGFDGKKQMKNEG